MMWTRVSGALTAVITVTLAVGVIPSLGRQNVDNMTEEEVLLDPKLFFVTCLVIFVTAVARPVCPDLLG